jgi:hypothetical protein
MVLMKDEAVNYRGVVTKNISELASIPIDINVEEKTFKKGTPDEFTIKTINMNGEEYRVPKTVLKNLQAILKVRPDIKTFKVERTGTGINDTSYAVIPLD